MSPCLGKGREGALYPPCRRSATCRRTSAPHPNSLAVLDLLVRLLPSSQSAPKVVTEYSTIRQAKETLGQRRLDIDTARDQVQAAVVQGWGQTRLPRRRSLRPKSR